MPPALLSGLCSCSSSCSGSSMSTPRSINGSISGSSRASRCSPSLRGPEPGRKESAGTSGAFCGSRGAVAAVAAAAAAEGERESQSSRGEGQEQSGGDARGGASQRPPSASSPPKRKALELCCLRGRGSELPFNVDAGAERRRRLSPPLLSSHFLWHESNFPLFLCSLLS